uniref:Anillin, actin binding protein 2 n=1 Tax=Takifugu rubripes TaxID=31033 RepID=A0A674N058_TAKRU
MEAGEGSGALKRQRAALSDSEDNAWLPPGSDGQKRRRVEPAGRENRSPEASSSGRLAGLQTRAEPPTVPSVRSRVQLLTRRQDGGAPLAQRCLSDPGANSPTVFNEKRFNEHFLGAGEFHQRLERFKVPTFEGSVAAAKSPDSPPPRTCGLVSGLQQKLQCSLTPSSQQASRIREERRRELSQLQPICENAWLKRSNSDPSLSQIKTPTAPHWVPPSPSIRGLQWHPKQPWDADDDAKIKDGSFIASGAEKNPPDETAVPVEHENGPEVQQQKECNLEDALPGEGAGEAAEPKASQRQVVLKLSFSEDQRFSTTSFGEEHSEDNPSPLEITHLMAPEVFVLTEEPREHLRAPEIKGDVHSFPAEERVNIAVGNLPQRSRESYLASCRDVLEDKDHRPDVKEVEPESGVDDAVKEPSTFSTEPGSMVSSEGGFEGPQRGSTAHFPLKPGPDAVARNTCEETTLGLIISKHADLKPEKTKLFYSVEQSQPGALEFKANGVEQKVKTQAEALEHVCTDTPGHPTEAHVADKDLAEVDQGPENKELVEEETKGKAEIGERSKKVTFLLEADVLGEATLTESIAPMGSSTRTIREVSCHDEKNSADSLDQMFEEVFEHVDRMEEGGGGGEDDHDSSVGAEMKTEPEEQTTQQEPEKTKNCEDIEEELLTFPPSGILSPLSKSVEAVVTPLRLTVSQEASHLPSHPAESAPLYSVDAYRTQRRTKNPTVQSAPPDARRAPQKPPAPVDSKEKITALNEEAGKLQTVISQTMQALSCCTDEVHGRGSLEEAEAEKLLLVSCEKRSALLAEITRLRDERSSGEASGEDSACVDQQPCRGTVGITNIRLPLKLEFVCSSHNRPGRPSHYFFVLIRYGPCSIAATPLATAADAQNGDTISFPTSVTLKDIRSSFEIDVEVYSLSHTSASCPLERPTTRSRVTPRKLLNTITRSSNGMASAAAPLNSRRSSTFCLVGSHKITLASLGLSKFPLDKMKLDGKIRRLLGDEFQEKVPFLSPLEGHIYLQLDSKSHSLVHHQGFLTMFELISGFGVWNRRYFVLKECTMYYWNHPNDEGTKEAENSIALSDCYQSVRAVQRDLCARPFTFELVSARPPQQDGGDQALARFSADTKQERLDWMEKLSQVLLDFHTWNPRSAAEAQGGQSGGGVREGGRASWSGGVRESIL